MKLNIVCIPGDGIGPEIVNEAKKVLDAVGAKFGHEMDFTDILMGGASIDVHGVPLTDEAIETSTDCALWAGVMSFQAFWERLRTVACALPNCAEPESGRRKPETTTSSPPSVDPKAGVIENMVELSSGEAI